MDLMAFLPPAVDLPVMVAVEEEGGLASFKGRLVARQGRPSWFCPVPQPSGRTLILLLELPNFKRADDGGLEAAGPACLAPIYLLSRVRGCRYFSPQTTYLLKLDLLGRIWPEPTNLR